MYEQHSAVSALRVLLGSPVHGRVRRWQAPKDGARE